MKCLDTELNIENMFQLYTEDCIRKYFDTKLRAKKGLYYDLLNKNFKLSFKPPEIYT